MTTPTNTPTPRTDEAQKEYAYVGNKGAVHASFARTLELETIQLKQELAEAKQALGYYQQKGLEADINTDGIIEHNILGHEWPYVLAGTAHKLKASRNHFKQLAETWQKMAERLDNALRCLNNNYAGNPDGQRTIDIALSHYQTLQQKKDEPCSTEEKSNS